MTIPQEVFHLPFNLLLFARVQYLFRKSLNNSVRLYIRRKFHGT